MMFGRALDLTDAQKEQAKAIFEETRKANETYREQLRSLRAEEREAIKAGKSENELRNLAQRSANVTADMHANRLVAQSKFWQILTPEQRAKLEERGEKMRERMREGKGRFGRGFRAQ
jgi:protein CpxP